MNNMTNATDPTGDTWRRAFADALIEIQPHINPDAADELSDSAFIDLGTLPPKRAAEICSKGGRSHLVVSRIGKAGPNCS